MNYEKNLPTEQVEKKTIPWIQSKNGDSRRSKSYSQKKTKRSLETSCVNFSFKKEMHIRKKWEFRKIYSIGSKYYGRYVCFQYILKQNSNSKLGLTVSKKYGNAIQRNFFKRRMRELFRTLNPTFEKSIHVNILPLNIGKKASFNDLQTDWKNFTLYLKNKGLTNEKQT